MNLLHSGAARSVSAGVAVALSMVALAACSSGSSSPNSSASESQPAATKLQTVTLTDQPGTGVTTLIDIAQAKGFFRQAGIDAKLVTVTSGPAAATALASGSVDIATNAPEVFTPLISRGVKLQLIAGQTKTLAVIAARKGFNAPSSFPGSIRALKGKKVGVTALSSTEQYLVQTALKAAGLPANSVTFVAVGANADQALVAGQVDAAVVVGPQVVLAGQQGAQNLLDLRTASTCPAQMEPCGIAEVGMWAQASWVKSHSTAVNDVRKAIAKANEYVHASANRAKVTAFLSGSMSHSSAGLLATYVNQQLAVLTNAFPKASLAAWLKFDYAHQIIPTPVDVNSVYAPGTPG